jgi:hypothetical protein
MTLSKGAGPGRAAVVHLLLAVTLVAGCATPPRPEPRGDPDSPTAHVWNTPAPPEKEAGWWDRHPVLGPLVVVGGAVLAGAVAYLAYDVAAHSKLQY